MKQQEEIIEINDNDDMQVQLSNNAVISDGCSPFDLQFKIGVQTLNKIQEAAIKKNHLLKRLISYYLYNASIQPGKQHFFPRREPNYQKMSTKTIENQLILYGSDFAKFKQLKKDYKCIIIEKIDDSHCKLTFKNRSDAQKSIRENIKDLKEIALKLQSENQPLSKSWFQMKPYIYLNNEIKVFVRFATSQELVIDSTKQSELQTYKVSKQRYNYQQQMKLNDDAIQKERKRQKIEILKQRKTERLYDDFRNKNDEQWKQGRNKNPGANRQQEQNNRVRSRSRDNDHLEARSTYSISKINKSFNNMNLQQIDLSFHIDKPAENKINNRSEYNWGGLDAQKSVKGFSYKKYEQEKQEEELRQKSVVHVICLD